MSFIFPNYDGENVLNVSASLSSFLGNPNGNKTIPELDNALKKGYKRVLFLVFDALGTYPLEKLTPKDGFFRSHTIKTLTTVFPSTTACATATMISGKYPSEHGRFGWCMYLPEFGKRVDVLTGSVSDVRGETVPEKPLRALFPIRGFYLDNKTDYRVSSVLSRILDDGNKNRYTEETVGGVFLRLREICFREGKQFVYVHCPQPDNIFHHRGLEDERSKEMVEEIERQTKRFLEDFSDTLVIVTADHGQTEATGYVPLYADKKLESMLSSPLHVEVRAVNFSVKKGMETEFENYFAKNYGEHFTLLKTEELTERGVFGPRTDKLERYLGNYFGVGTDTRKTALLHPLTSTFLAHHTGAGEEMKVPLILLHS